jgi:SagB-type dehydrogenase family enzyme
MHQNLQGGLMAMGEGVGDRFQRETKYYRESLKGRMLDWANKPDTYKEYPGRKSIELPPFDSVKTTDLKQVLERRKSIRHFSAEPLTLEELSYLLWSSSGIQRKERGHEFRTSPSAGALYPIETYLVAGEVEGLTKGLYHYSVKRHVLEELRLGDLLQDAAMAALNQKMCLEAPATLIWTAVFRRSKWKYEQRAYRYVYLDAGHIAENLALAATAAGLGTCQVGALFDDEVNALVGVDGVEESVVYMSVAGHPA